MAEQLNPSNPIKPEVTDEDVKRVLEIGRILLAVLTPQELDQLQQIMSSQMVDELNISSLFSEAELGNTGVT
jgi:hypothetical protein